MVVLTKKKQTCEAKVPLTMKQLCSFSFKETKQWSIITYDILLLETVKKSNLPTLYHLCILSFELAKSVVSTLSE